ncbi:kelch repeat and BTB domain-containing protein 8-like [Cimex lectularius]|uniref:BTB domain-containing protein n=1 Tax=Cimex lectularius TaxID=79782 RepID=A0A8I6RY84_CIMLE|nr:kelch repeat and BTB domain-containing protein 8-like [Cimex lectularius]XP_014254582.1 kelch repeat and BTB domain-containing protein 8-like [Cimex lectularius]XP_014254583.1 kelch repeat and BTB domain-containing protein 8-like [Cimex lectularius]
MYKPARFSLKGSFSASEWRRGCKTWNERMSILYKTKYGSDVVLKVKNDDKETHFSAHKFVLKMSSQVLETIMNTEVCLKNKDPAIIFTNVDEEAFGHYIKYLYTSTVALSSTAQAIEIFRIADKFNAPDLAELCYAYIVGHLDPSNVMPCYMFADVHGMEELKLRCLTLIQNDTKQVVNSENITRFDVQSLIILLNQPALSIRDFELFKLIERWIKVCEGSELCNLCVAHNPAIDLKKKFHHLLMTRFRHMSIPPEELAHSNELSQPFNTQSDQKRTPGESNTTLQQGNQGRRGSRQLEPSRNEQRSASLYRLNKDENAPPPNIGIQQVSSVVPKYLSNKLNENAGRRTSRN